MTNVRQITKNESKPSPFDKFGDDSGWLKLCAEWHVARAEYQEEEARRQLATCWFEGDEFPDEEISPPEDGEPPIDRMVGIEEMMRTWTPCTVFGAEQLLKICIMILVKHEEDPRDDLGDGPVIEYLMHIRKLLSENSGVELKSPPHDPRPNFRGSVQWPCFDPTANSRSART